MADTWTFDAGTNSFALALDGSGSGVESRSQTFSGLTADTLYTWYMAFTTESEDVEPFLEVDGGERDTGTGTSGTLRVRGTTNGSGEITLRFGVGDAGAAPLNGAFDALSYANQAAAEAAGWTVTDTAPNGTITFAESPIAPGGGYTTGIRYALSGPGVGIGNQMQMAKTFSLTGSALYRIRLWVDPNGNHFEELDIGIANSTHTSVRNVDAGGGEAAGERVSGTITTQPDGDVLVTITKGTGFGVAHADTYDFAGMTLEQVGGAVATDVTWGAITYCSGTGLPDDPGTGLGGDPDTPGDDPIPDPPPGGYPPPPVGGDRPFGIHDIPAAGFGFWNSTVKQVTSSNVVNILNAGGTGSAKLILSFGGIHEWLDAAGKFQFTRWKAVIDACYDNTAIRAAINAKVTDGTFWAHRLLDEPNRADRYGGVIPIAVVEQMAVYSKSLFPGLRTLLRCSPIVPWFTRHITACDAVWAEYLLARGDVTTYRNATVAAAEGFGHQIILGIHYKDFDRPWTNRLITPSELRHYGGILASSTSDAVIGMNGWRYDGTMYNQPGFPDALKYVRDLFASLDP